MTCCRIISGIKNRGSQRVSPKTSLQDLKTVNVARKNCAETGWYIAGIDDILSIAKHVVGRSHGGAVDRLMNA